MQTCPVTSEAEIVQVCPPGSQQDKGPLMHDMKDCMSHEETRSIMCGATATEEQSRVDAHQEITLHERKEKST